MIITGLVAATVAADHVVGATATTSASGCIAPRLVGLTERAAQRTSQRSGLRRAPGRRRLKQAKVQTVADQTPAAGPRTVAVRLTLNPLCFGSALAGPPHDQGMRPGPPS